MLEGMDVFSIAGFSFFLVILSVGYYAVEIMGGRKYIYRQVFDAYENSLFDRIVHYIIWGLLINFAVIFLYLNTSGIDHLLNIANGAGKIADVLYRQGDNFELQVVIFSCAYFSLIFGLLVLINFIIWIIGAAEPASVWILERLDKKMRLETVEGEG